MFASVLPVALPDDSTVFVRGVPDLGAESLAAVATDDAGREDAVTAVLSPLGLAPGHFKLNDFPFIRRDDRLMALFHIVLRRLTLIRFSPLEDLTDKAISSIGLFFIEDIIEFIPGKK